VLLDGAKIAEEFNPLGSVLHQLRHIQTTTDEAHTDPCGTRTAINWKGRRLGSRHR